MATQLSIAKQLNLSKATVSRILSGNISHDDQTRARVLALAAQLGYRHLRPTVRQRTARKKPVVIGVTLEVNDESPPEAPVVMLRALRGISSAARMQNAMVQLDYSPRHERQHLREHELAFLQEGHLSGLILGGGFTPEAIRELARKVHCVRLNNREANVDVDCVGQNDADAVEVLVAHLSELGHDRIGFLSEPGDEWPAQARQAGYFKAMMQRGRQHDLQIVLSPSLSGDKDALATCHRQIADRISSGVRAWICYHDGLGYELVRVLQEQGWRVPEDVSVAGFDNLPPPSEDFPKLVSIDWPFEDIGAAAVRRLLRRLQEPAGPPVYMQLNGRLVAGKSTAKCPR
jgi:LacI family transcriptional regulator